MIGWSLMKTHLASVINTNKTDIEDWRKKRPDLSLVSKIKLDDISVHYFHSLASPICVFSKQKAISFFLFLMFVKQIKRRFHYVHFNHFFFPLKRLISRQKASSKSRKSSKKNRKSLLSQLSGFSFFFSGKKLSDFDEKSTKGFHSNHANGRGKFVQLTTQW